MENLNQPSGASRGNNMKKRKKKKKKTSWKVGGRTSKMKKEEKYPRY